MSPEQARSMYRRQIAAHGEPVTLKRVSPAAEATIRARVTGFRPEEIASGIDQGSRKVIALAEDVEAVIASGAWPAPAAGGVAVGKVDRMLVRGRQMVVEAVDDSTRRVAGVLVAYEITVSGS